MIIEKAIPGRRSHRLVWGFWSRHRLTRTYGPPRGHKRKMKVRGSSAQMYPAFVEHKLLVLDGMRRALVLFGNAALEGIFRFSLFPAALQIGRGGESSPIAKHSDSVPSSLKFWPPVEGCSLCPPHSGRQGADDQHGHIAMIAV